MRHIPKPKEGEYAPYASRYIDAVPEDGMVLQQLAGNLQVVRELVMPLSEEALRYRYAPGKWTIRQILQHIMDAERVFAYRALAFARGDKNELPGFSENDYAAQAANADERSIGNLMEEYEAVRRGSLTLFNSFDDEALGRMGIANKINVSVRALPYYAAGHEIHHINIIKERYLN